MFRALEAAVAVLKSRNEAFDEAALNLIPEPARPEKIRRPFRYLRSLFHFIASPDTHRINTGVKNRLLLTLRIYLLTTLLVLVVFTTHFLMAGWWGISLPKHTQTLPDASYGMTDLYQFVLLLPVLAGVLEELMFRLPLTAYNKKYIDISLACLVSFAFIFSQVRYSRALLFETASGALVFYSLLPVALGTVLYYNFRRSSFHTRNWEQNWPAVFPKLFYISAVLFSVLHLPNYEWELAQLPLIPVILLPYLIYAFAFSYVRVRIGFWYAVGLHFFIDLLAMISQLNSILR